MHAQQLNGVFFVSSHAPLSYPRDGVAGVDHVFAVVQDRRRASNGQREVFVRSRADAVVHRAHGVGPDDAGELEVELYMFQIEIKIVCVSVTCTFLVSW